MDNLRYISLQYIKGDNYEKIQCFKYEEIMELLAYIKLSGDYSTEILDDLKKMKEKDKCPVGESFLNDLVSYYNFKDIRDAIEEIDENAKGDLVFQNKKKEHSELNKIIKSNNYDSGSIIKLLDNVKTGTEAKVESKLINLGSKLERALSAVNDAKKNLEDFEENLVIETLIAASSASEKRNLNPTKKKEYYFDEKKLKEATSKVEKISTLKSILEQAETNFDTAVIESIRDIATDINSITKKTEKELTKLEDNELTDAIKKSTTVYNNMKIIEDMITKGIDSKKFEEHAKLFEEEKGVKERVKKEKKKKKEKEVKEKTESDLLIDKIFSTSHVKNNIMNMLHDTNTNTITNKKLVLIWQGILEYDDEREKVMALLKIYRKICDRNISKFGNLFTKTDISSIDDAFMIKSYAVFLDKFEKIKKSLEGKDLTKLQRGLSISLEKLFDLYGINDPDALLQSPNDEDTKYLYEHIIQ
jgi:hypothetical protein